MPDKKQHIMQLLSRHVGLEEESPIEVGVIIVGMLICLLLAGSFFYLVIR